MHRTVGGRIASLERYPDPRVGQLQDRQGVVQLTRAIVN